jgi:hypothetical protein
MLRKFLKEKTRVLDALRIFGGKHASGERGIRMPDGSPVPVEHIMSTFGVDHARAAEIAQRQTR